MGGRVPEPEDSRTRSWTRPPPRLLPAALLAVMLLVALLLNGRPIGSGDTRATERVAASLASEGDFDLDEYPEIEPPFSRTVGAHRVSIYPVLSALAAAPLFLAGRPLFVLDEAGTALLGKLAASLFSALAAALLALAIGWRRSWGEGARTAVVFALCTSVWSTSQGLWQHPLAVLCLCMALMFVTRALQQADPVWVGRAGLPLALAVAARHADVALVAAFSLVLLAQFPRQIARFVLWATPAVMFVLGYQWLCFGSPVSHGFSGSLGRFSEPWGSGHLGLLLSPAKGLLVFTPVCLLAIAGLVRAWRSGEAGLAAAAAAGALAHWLLMGRWSEWHGGESWGPRMLTDALPLLFLFLPDGLARWPGLGIGAAALSLAAQLLGAFSYDYRWEKLYQRPSPEDTHAALWDVARSPLVYYAERGVFVLAAPVLRSDRVQIHEHPVMPWSPVGSRVEFAGEAAVVSGADATLGSVHLERAARVVGNHVHLAARWDAVFLRLLPAARTRRLELRLAGAGKGVLYVGERTFWGEPRFKTYPVAGRFRIRHPYSFADSGGGDLTITVGRGGGEVDLESVALVAPSDPETPLRLP